MHSVSMRLGGSERPEGGGLVGRNGPREQKDEARDVQPEVGNE